MSREGKKSKRQLSLTARVTLAFVAVIIIPVILIGVFLLMPMSSRLRSLGQTYGVENLSYSGMYNNSNMIAKVTKDALADVTSRILADPSVIQKETPLRQIAAGYAEEKSYLVIVRDGSILFNSSPMNSERLLELLSSRQIETEAGENDWLEISAELQTLVMGRTLSLPDGEIRVYMLTDMNQIWPGIRRWLSDLVLVCILILMATAVLVGIWLYSSTVNPLNQLKKAARNIRDGNLDFHVEAKGATEIAEVCEDFEEMRKRLKESAEEKLAVDKGNKELISNISHDLKTPITAIRGYCEGIIDGVADTPEKMDRYVRTIYNKANEMDKLINELTFYSRIDTNRIPYTFTKINVTDFFNDCAEELRLETESRGIGFTYRNELTDPDTLIIGDAEQLNRVVHNIISNSIKYMDKPEKRMEIRLLDKDDFIQAEFEDNGKGIAAGELPLIFDRFFRTDASRNSSKGGSGIGLSIVRKILEDHGGKVWASSTEGEGTTIHFVIRKYQEVRVNE